MHTVRVRSQRTTEGGNRRSLDTWIGRLAMLGFAAAIGVEVSTGKGLLAVRLLNQSYLLQIISPLSFES